MSEQTPGRPAPAAAPQRFQAVDADAVCEQCGTVNDDGTLLCRVCGQNLRDQRARRLAGVQAPDMGEAKVSRVRIFTGVLSVAGILLVILIVLNLPRIEAVLTSELSEAPIASVGSEALFSGPDAAIYDNLLAELNDYPSTRAQVQDAIETPLAEATYNGRYVLMPAGALTPDRAIGEAAVSRRGNRVYFVALISQPFMEIRGSALLEEVQNDGEEAAIRPVVRNSAGYIDENGTELRGFGLAEPLATGGHRVFVIQDAGNEEETGQQTQVFAYRIR